MKWLKISSFTTINFTVFKNKGNISVFFMSNILPIPSISTEGTSVSTTRNDWNKHYRTTNLLKARLIVVRLFVHQRLYWYQKTGKAKCWTPCRARPCPVNSKHSKSKLPDICISTYPLCISLCLMCNYRGIAWHPVFRRINFSWHNIGGIGSYIS